MFDPMVRWRNFTLENLKSLLEIYPDMQKELVWDEAKLQINKNLPIYRRTAYQMACQLGLENRSSEKYEIQNYVFFLDEKGLEQYLKFWFKLYFAPNPYVKSDDDAFLLYCDIADSILKSDNLEINFDDYIKSFVKGNSDIFLNVITNLANPIKFSKRGELRYLYIEKDDKSFLKDEIEMIKNSFPINNHKDKNEFFQRFNYNNFCKFYNIKRSTLDDLVRKKSRYKKNRVGYGMNILYFGIPGCGKSYKIKNMLEYKENLRQDAENLGIHKPVSSNNIIRTTFYSDYSNSDFIGQILPSVEDGIVYYKHVPGPFTKALQRAMLTEEMVFLIIEEINRGNAAAIFGDLFQLLDRKKVDEGEYKAGDSEYPISNNFLEEYLNIEQGKVIIPSNLTIIATMNTNDQNVFPLDTAFKRRWKKKKVTTNVDDEPIGKRYIPGTSLQWCKFVNAINNWIMSSDESINGEDKQLGAFYINENTLEEVKNITNFEVVEEFCDNVISYIWEDISKFEKERWFKQLTNGLPKSYDEIIEHIKVHGNNPLSPLKDDIFYENNSVRMKNDND